MSRLFCLPRKCPAVSAVTDNVPTMAGFAFLAAVLNVSYRRVVGWAMALTCALTCSSMRSTSRSTEARHRASFITHTKDRGRYTSIAFTKRGESADVHPSIELLGDCYDYAMCENFNATLECE